MRTVTWAWEMRSTWWAWLASRPPPSRCDTLSGSPSHTPDHTPGPAPGDTPPAAPAPPPDTRGAGPGRHQDTQLGVIIMISWQSWHCSAIICKQLRCPVITAAWWSRALSLDLIPLSRPPPGPQQCWLSFLFWTFSSDRDRKLLACAGMAHVYRVTEPSSENYWSRRNVTFICIFFSINIWIHKIY